MSISKAPERLELENPLQIRTLKYSNAAEAEIHIDGGTNAILSLDANANANNSTLQFQKAGSTQGSINFNHRFGFIRID